ncbi:hypothetical protein [Streptomyces griseus]|uniref:hypothetical protein n=1 Tax=Streptomyces griseus TaxID=1911 RepID=UPI000AC2A9EE|nr:hypothetical protein [Streptomyces griseus]
MTTGWGARTLRAAVFAAVCVLLAALGHVMMSGVHVPWWTLAAGLGATGAVGWGLAGRERGLPLIVSAVVAAQTALHTGFSLAQPGTGAVRTGSLDMAHMAHMGAMSHPGQTDVGPMAYTEPMGQMGHMTPLHSPGSLDSLDFMDPLGVMARLGEGSSSLGMLGAHLLAALLCGLWLACGERAAFRILRAVAGRLAAPLRLLLALPEPTHRPRPPARRRRSARAPRLLLLVHSIISRGPPVGGAVA